MKTFDKNYFWTSKKEQDIEALFIWVKMSDLLTQNCIFGSQINFDFWHYFETRTIWIKALKIDKTELIEIVLIGKKFQAHDL